MACRSLSSLAAVALALSLAACSGGSSGGGSVNPGPGPNNPGSVTITPSALAFAGAGSPAQSFTLSSTVPGVTAPTIDPFGCGTVATISTTSTTLPAVYTVTPTGNGGCTFVVNMGHQSATVGITVGAGAGSPIISGGGTVSLFLGGTSGSVTVNASSGTLTPDTSACSGIATITANGGNTATSQTYTISPLSAGSCTFTIVDGASSVSVPISVQSTGSGAGVFVSPSAMTIASPRIDPFSCPSQGSTCAYGPSQSGTITFTGNIGQVAVDEHECIGGPPVGGPNTMAFLTIPGSPPAAVSLPTNFTVNSYGNKLGVCHIFINPQFGTGATLTVTIN